MIPSFIDVAMNFGNDEMKIDTFLHQLHRKKEKIVFAGDDTWKMFNFFHREYSNSDSLFVNDFYRGDRNVTDSMRFELKNDDWRLLILRKFYTFFKVTKIFLRISNFNRLFGIGSYWTC
jgi:ethanolamine phosphate transferase 2 subunit G